MAANTCTPTTAGMAAPFVLRSTRKLARALVLPGIHPFQLLFKIAMETALGREFGRPFVQLNKSHRFANPAFGTFLKCTLNKT